MWSDKRRCWFQERSRRLRRDQGCADYLVTSLNGERFSWGARFGADPDELRAAYLDALHRADDGEITRLLTFARA